MPEEGPQAVLWDMDGTLLDSERVWDVSLHELARHLGGELSEDTRRQMVGSSLDTSMGLLFAELDLPPEAQAVRRAGEWLLARTGELFDGGLTWRPGAQAALDLVAAQGLPMALVTNTGRVLTERALTTVGRDRFAATVCGDEVQRGKPAPDPYLRAAELLGVNPHQCLAIEDSPTGTASAEAAGCSVLVVPCEVDVPAGPARVFRDSLTGLTATALADAWSVGVRC
ncbi:MAG: HAD family phosphatase [Actinomycetota bacterium]|nr:HAD family phosphatase [Actinomycetota bacterium]